MTAPQGQIAPCGALNMSVNKTGQNMNLDPPLARALLILADDVADSGRTYGPLISHREMAGYG